MLEKKYCLLFGSIILILMGNFFYPHNKVNLFYKDKMITISTSAKTVEEAVEEAKIPLCDDDKIIPPVKSLVSDNMTIKILKAKPIFIIVDGKGIKRLTYKKTVKELLQEMSIKLKKGDTVKPDLKKLLKEEKYNYICIKRAKDITLQIGDNIPVKIKSTKKYVYQILQDKGIKVSSEDRLYPSPQTPVVQGTKIEFTEVSHKVLTEKEIIPYQIITREDPTLPEGERVVVQEGKEGITRHIIKAYYKNNKLSSEKMIGKEIICRSQDEIVLIGTKVETYMAPEVNVASDSNVNANYTINMEATAYDRGSGYTASGIASGYGVVAVDPAVIPLGTKLYIEGYGYAIAADTGSAIWGKRIDLCFNSYEEAVSFGRRNVKVYILE